MTQEDVKEVANKFYETTGKNHTDTEYLRTIEHSADLLHAGYTKEDIILCLEYLAINPPKNGLSSMAFIQHVIAEVITKIKIQKLKETTNNITTEFVVKKSNKKAITPQERVGEEFDFLK